MRIKNIISFIASILALSIPLVAQQDAKEQSTPAPLDYIEQNGQKFVHVSTVNTVEANTQFMQNMQLVNQQRQALLELNKRKEIAFTQAEKDAIDAKMKELTESLTKNSDTMMKAYGYSLTRDSIPVFIKTRIYRKLTDAEYATMQKDKSIAEKLLVKGDDKYVLIHIIESAKDNILFQNSINVLQRQVAQYEKVREALKGMMESADKTKLAEENAKLGEIVEKNKAEVAKLYGGFDLGHNYLMEVEESKLYVKVTEEEFLKAQEQQKENALKEEAKAIVNDDKAVK